MSEEDRGLDGLLAELIAKTKEMAATDHIGHRNRLFMQRDEIFKKIGAHPDGPDALARLLDDPDPRLRVDVAAHCKFAEINAEAAMNTLRSLATRSDEIGFDARMSLKHPVERGSDDDSPTPVARTFPFLPAPRGCGRDEAEKMIEAAFAPERVREIIALLRPAIRMWPKKSAGSPTASRFGGLPAAPADWQWPFADEEPFVFLAQINCAELGALAPSHGLPARGILSFFGDRGEIEGIPTNGGKVFYFAEPDELALRQLPMAEDEPLISCDMSFYETFELPHPFSAAADALGVAPKHNREEWDAYFELYEALAEFDISEDQRTGENDISKLLGWPDLVQGELDGGDGLLLQLGEYHDGQEIMGWGPGGLLYFMLHPADLAAGKFSAAELEVQVT
jgi:uncharacterized protein YwqG